MIDAGLRISREAITKKRKQPFERLRFGGMVMSPEGMETIIGPHAVQIFKASLVMGVALDVVEEIARLRPREQVKAFAWLCRTQLEGGFEIGSASCRERCVSTCRSRWSPDH